MNRLLFAALAFCAGIPLLLQTEAVAQRDCNSKQFVVSAVNLPPETHLSSQEQATVRLRLVGRCFDESQLTEATDRVRVAFQSFSYGAQLDLGDARPQQTIRAYGAPGAGKLRIYEQMKATWKGSREYLLAQVIRLVEKYIESHKLRIEPPLFNQDNLRRRIIITLHVSVRASLDHE